ncbi:hypothetical protein CBR_g12200 [Chara braunii]|uniref:Uncharacterized protein n=1 Tax=Chara braunii TaxID=69332 RepID=A0A388KRG1_CHABU|nr:hypothetical protein CBR_g12200 [Chara braunii]|eukprot:GBG72626.1 hypothetical protein CBR_g12200 [Chara braunii]
MIWNPIGQRRQEGSDAALTTTTTGRRPPDQRGPSLSPPRGRGDERISMRAPSPPPPPLAPPPLPQAAAMVGSAPAPDGLAGGGRRLIGSVTDFLRPCGVRLYRFALICAPADWARRWLHRRYWSHVSDSDLDFADFGERAAWLTGSARREFEIGPRVDFRPPSAGGKLLCAFRKLVLDVCDYLDWAVAMIFIVLLATYGHVAAESQTVFWLAWGALMQALMSIIATNFAIGGGVGAGRRANVALEGDVPCSFWLANPPREGITVGIWVHFPMLLVQDGWQILQHVAKFSLGIAIILVSPYDDYDDRAAVVEEIYAPQVAENDWRKLRDTLYVGAITMICQLSGALIRAFMHFIDEHNPGLKAWMWHYQRHAKLSTCTAFESDGCGLPSHWFMSVNSVKLSMAWGLNRIHQWRIWRRKQQQQLWSSGRNILFGAARVSAAAELDLGGASEVSECIVRKYLRMSMDGLKRAATYEGGRMEILTDNGFDLILFAAKPGNDPEVRVMAASIIDSFFISLARQAYTEGKVSLWAMVKIPAKRRRRGGGGGGGLSGGFADGRQLRPNLPWRAVPEDSTISQQLMDPIFLDDEMGNLTAYYLRAVAIFLVDMLQSSQSSAEEKEVAARALMSLVIAASSSVSHTYGSRPRHRVLTVLPRWMRSTPVEEYELTTQLFGKVRKHRRRQLIFDPDAAAAAAGGGAIGDPHPRKRRSSSMSAAPSVQDERMVPDRQTRRLSFSERRSPVADDGEGSMVAATAGAGRSMQQTGSVVINVDETAGARAATGGGGGEPGTAMANAEAGGGVVGGILGMVMSFARIPSSISLPHATTRRDNSSVNGVEIVPDVEEQADGHDGGVLRSSTVRNVNILAPVQQGGGVSVRSANTRMAAGAGAVGTSGSRSSPPPAPPRSRSRTPLAPAPRRRAPYAETWPWLSIVSAMTEEMFAGYGDPLSEEDQEQTWPSASRHELRREGFRISSLKALMNASEKESNSVECRVYALSVLNELCADDICCELFLGKLKGMRMLTRIVDPMPDILMNVNNRVLDSHSYEREINALKLRVVPMRVRMAVVFLCLNVDEESKILSQQDIDTAERFAFIMVTLSEGFFRSIPSAGMYLRVLDELHDAIIRVRRLPQLFLSRFDHWQSNPVFDLMEQLQVITVHMNFARILHHLLQAFAADRPAAAGFGSNPIAEHHRWEMKYRKELDMHQRMWIRLAIARRKIIRLILWFSSNFSHYFSRDANYDMFFDFTTLEILHAHNHDRGLLRTSNLAPAHGASTTTAISASLLSTQQQQQQQQQGHRSSSSLFALRMHSHLVASNDVLQQQQQQQRQRTSNRVVGCVSSNATPMQRFLNDSFNLWKRDLNEGRLHRDDLKEMSRMSVNLWLAWRKLYTLQSHTPKTFEDYLNEPLLISSLLYLASTDDRDWDRFLLAQDRLYIVIDSLVLVLLDVECAESLASIPGTERRRRAEATVAGGDRNIIRQSGVAGAGADRGDIEEEDSLWHPSSTWSREDWARPFMMMEMADKDDGRVAISLLLNEEREDATRATRARKDIQKKAAATLIKLCHLHEHVRQCVASSFNLRSHVEILRALNLAETEDLAHIILSPDPIR